MEELFGRLQDEGDGSFDEDGGQAIVSCSYMEVCALRRALALAARMWLCGWMPVEGNIWLTMRFLKPAGWALPPSPSPSQLATHFEIIQSETTVFTCTSLSNVATYLVASPQIYNEKIYDLLQPYKNMKGVRDPRDVNRRKQGLEAR